MITYIHAKPPKDTMAKYWFNGAGFYFVDEASSLIGPYDTMSSAEKAEKEYADWLNGGII